MIQSTLPLDVETLSSKALSQLLTAPMPLKTDSYTPISHNSIINKTNETLGKLGFVVKKTIYRSAMEGYIGQGEYHLQYGNDKEMGLMIAWQNSYNKMISFKYAIGAHVFICSNGCVAGDIGAYKRKHTGEADHEAFGKIETYLQDASVIFDRLVSDKEHLKTVSLSNRKMAELVGRMFIENQIITSTQLNIMKREMEKPSFEYDYPLDSAWALYNHATHAFKEDSPRNWMKRHVDLHDFFSAEFMGKPIPAPSFCEDCIQEEESNSSAIDSVIDMF